MLGAYREYVDVTEMGLAFECLVDAADAQSAPREAWKRLRFAAQSMELDDDTPPHDEWVRRVNQHLID